MTLSKDDRLVLAERIVRAAQSIAKTDAGTLAKLFNDEWLAETDYRLVSIASIIDPVWAD